MPFAVFPWESSDESLEELSLIGQCGKVPVTNCALEWFLSCMDPLMVLQVSWSWKSLATLCAIEWLISSVLHESSPAYMGNWAWVLALGGNAPLWRHCSLHKQNPISRGVWPPPHAHLCSPDVGKLLSHLVYFNGCFLHGSSDHLFKSHDHEKLLPHFMHLNCFFPVSFLSCIMMWKSSWDFNGFSFMDPLMVLFKCFDPEKLLPHFVQLNGFSPVQFPSWIFTWPEKLPSHLLHFNGCFLQGSCDGTSSLLILNSSCHTICNWMAPLQCDSLHESSPDVEKLLWHLAYFNGCFLQGTSDQMVLQVSLSWKSLAKLYALEWLLSSVTPFINPHLHWVAAQRSPLLSSSAVTITSLK